MAGLGRERPFQCFPLGFAIRPTFVAASDEQIQLRGQAGVVHRIGSQCFQDRQSFVPSALLHRHAATEVFDLRFRIAARVEFRDRRRNPDEIPLLQPHVGEWREQFGRVGKDGDAALEARHRFGLISTQEFEPREGAIAAEVARVQDDGVLQRFLRPPQIATALQ